MAHYAILDENNIVTQVFVGKDEEEPCVEGFKDWEEYYGAKRTSYNTFAGKHTSGGTPFRGNYAGIGYYYDEEFDAFYEPQPFPSWKLNYETFTWNAPVERPPHEEHFSWKWSEVNKEWVRVTLLAKPE